MCYSHIIIRYKEADTVQILNMIFIIKLMHDRVRVSANNKTKLMYLRSILTWKHSGMLSSYGREVR